ncbi:hypothetical protein [Aliarcobacter vitoriensis]|uniref:Uncharacterized protein n=1 Tax=Aliarcobacter vitoriensis TaxID=2011099 RepID=A0A366MRB9_9BACT|nr:hypothetical protein [Aliarcobacter vitoriensis]RBQ28383.1 hypothetical protein CRU91_09185 [Aliarcobacter vitoriensis]
MDNNLKEILIEFQTQIHDLLQLQFDLNVSFNEQAKKLNTDFYDIYNEIYNSKTLEESKSFLKNKKFIVEQFNEMTDKRTQNVAKMFDERLNVIHNNLERIKETL